MGKIYSITRSQHKIENCKWWSNEEDEDRIECWAFCDYGLSSLKASGNHLLPMMAGPSSCRIEESGLITGPMSLDESTFSDLPVLVGSRLGDLDRVTLEPELLLSVPVITLVDSNDSNITQQSGPDSVCSLDLNCAGEIDIVELSEQEEAIIEETVEEEEVKDEPVSSPQAPDLTQEPSVFEAQTLFDLGSGTYAYLHDQPQDGCQVLKMDDGRVAYITVIPPLAKEQGQLKVEESPKKTKSFMCTHEGCGRLYTSAHHLKVHERTHSGTKPYMCTIEACGKAFSTDYSRKAHIRTHTGEKPYQCLHQDCNKGFKTSGDLQKHIRTHTGERPFICSVEGCNRSFTTSNIRKVHLRTHTGERPYICKEANCDKAFASATNYKNHIRIHSGEKPYACSVLGCNRKFTEYSSLYKHAMVHTQEKPYGCAVCGRSYRQASTLTVHKRSVHGVIETDDGTELVLGKLLTHRMLKRAAMLSDSAAVRSQENDEFMLDSEGPFQRTRRNKSLLSSEQIFIIEDMPEQYAALQHIQDPDDEELKAALGPLKEEEL